MITIADSKEYLKSDVGLCVSDNVISDPIKRLSLY